MARGGSRVRSGPPPDPMAVRRVRRDAGDWILLPVAGRPGEPPSWPLIDPSDRETDLWRLLWSKPQAVAWEQNGSQLEVALFVRRLSEAERPDSPTGLSTLTRQMADSLGLTTPGMRSNRWRIEDAPPAPTPRSDASSRGWLPARERVHVVAPEFELEP